MIKDPPRKAQSLCKVHSSVHQKINFLKTFEDKEQTVHPSSSTVLTEKEVKISAHNNNAVKII